MRRLFLVTVIAGLATGLMAGQALASSHSHQRFRSAAVVAVWQSKTRLSSTQFKLTTWFVGVFPSERGTFSQVDREVAKCHVVSGHRRCRGVSFAVGVRRNLTATQFTFDRRHLKTAHLDATYQLRTFTKPKRTFRVTIVADWAGTGKISRSGGIDNFRSGCLHFHDVFKNRQRRAIATGSENGKSLGSTKRAFLSTSSDLFVSHRC